MNGEKLTRIIGRLMDTLKKIGKVMWNWLVDKDQVDVTMARMTVEEVAEKARLIAAEEDWFSAFEQNEPRLERELWSKKLVWHVFFSLKGETHIYRGAHARLEIDDETGELLNKYFVPR